MFTQKLLFQYQKYSKNIKKLYYFIELVISNLNLSNLNFVNRYLEGPIPTLVN